MAYCGYLSMFFYACGLYTLAYLCTEALYMYICSYVQGTVHDGSIKHVHDFVGVHV